MCQGKEKDGCECNRVVETHEDLRKLSDDELENVAGGIAYRYYLRCNMCTPTESTTNASCKEALVIGHKAANPGHSAYIEAVDITA